MWWAWPNNRSQSLLVYTSTKLNSAQWLLRDTETQISLWKQTDIIPHITASSITLKYQFSICLWDIPSKSNTLIKTPIILSRCSHFNGEWVPQEGLKTTYIQKQANKRHCSLKMLNEISLFKSDWHYTAFYQYLKKIDLARCVLISAVKCRTCKGAQLTEDTVKCLISCAHPGMPSSFSQLTAGCPHCMVRIPKGGYQTSIVVSTTLISL